MAGSGFNQNPGEVPPSISRSPSDDAGLPQLLQILIIEDSRADVTLIRKALETSGVNASFHVVDDGEKAVRFFENADSDPAAPCPDLVILDINLPRFKGGEVLRRMRGSVRCANAPVLVVTSSGSAHDRAEMDRLGANGYFRKPSDFSEFMRLGDLARTILKLDGSAAGPAN